MTYALHTSSTCSAAATDASPEPGGRLRDAKGFGEGFAEAPNPRGRSIGVEADLRWYFTDGQEIGVPESNFSVVAAACQGRCGDRADVSSWTTTLQPSKVDILMRPVRTDTQIYRVRSSRG